MCRDQGKGCWWEGAGAHGSERATRTSEAKTTGVQLEAGTVETLSARTYSKSQLSSCITQGVAGPDLK